MDTATQRKCDAASRSFDFISFGDDHRLARTNVGFLPRCTGRY